MKASNYQCVNCQISYQIEANYIEHYKSQHHRYNVKRKLIGLPPVSFEEYHLQFDDEKTSKQSVDQEFYCEICSKKFGNSGTYKQHIASKKHKLNRQNLKAEKRTLSKSSSESDFEVIGAQKAETCLFCQTVGSPNHMKQVHNFPPFEHQCINYEGLVEFVQGKLAKYECVYCQTCFHSEESVRQHMNDLGHTKLDIENFGDYEKFYLWKIEESSSQSEQELTHLSPQKQDQSSLYEQLNPPTLQQLEQKRLARIKLTTTGAIINGKEVGYRHLKQYYKQYLNREIINLRQKYQPALQSENKSSFKMLVKPPERVPKIHQTVNTR